MLAFGLEKNWWKKGFIVIGVDEAGRGSLSGPIVSAAYAAAPQIQGLKFKIKNEGIKINDSKQLTAKQREKSSHWLKQNCLSFGTGVVDSKIINQKGIARAGLTAIRRAVYNLLDRLPDNTNAFLLSDFYTVPHIIGIGLQNQKAIVKGDTKCFSIAAASIIAKVKRDRLMRDLSKEYSVYGWEKNKGYGTKCHISAIKKYGPTKRHRTKFIRKIL